MMSTNLYNSKLDEKIAEIKDMVDSKKKELASLGLQKDGLERSLEERFVELEGKPT